MYGSPKRSALLSGSLHAAGIVLALALSAVAPQRPRDVVHSVPIATDIRAYLPKAIREPGGGGGGAGAVLPASRGRLPRQAARQFTPPVVEILNQEPRLVMEPTILVNPDVRLPRVDLAQYGIPNGVIGPPSGGPGSGGGIGPGHGTGVGPENGPGYGPGPGGLGFGSGGGGPRGRMTAPSVIDAPDPEYTDEARRAKQQGVVELYVEIDADGRVRSISVRRGLGFGLDERAEETVKHWRFRPATQNGRPVASPALVAVYFRLL